MYTHLINKIAHHIHDMDARDNLTGSLLVKRLEYEMKHLVPTIDYINHMSRLSNRVCKSYRSFEMT